MKRSFFHPYALIFGVGIGIMVLFALRHPLFALFAGIASTVVIDLALKRKNIDSDRKDGDE